MSGVDISRLVPVRPMVTPTLACWVVLVSSEKAELVNSTNAASVRGFSEGFMLDLPIPVSIVAWSAHRSWVDKLRKPIIG